MTVFLNCKYWALFFLMALCSSISYGQTTSIPDVNFEDYLETHNANGAVVSVGDGNSMGDGVENNGLVLTNRINTVNSLIVNNLSINNLEGIQDFVELQTLICTGNSLPNLNVANNLNLKTLLCSDNLLTSLDVSANLNLEELDCSNNQILALDFSNISQLKTINCSNNKLFSIDVSRQLDLSSLSISNNRINNINLSANIGLENLYCASNQLTNLNVTTNTSLKILDASNNAISNLDLSTINTQVCPDPQTNPVTACQGAASINVSNNQLVSLNLANGFNDLITSFKSQDNPDLFCIQIDFGFTATSNWEKDDWTYFSNTTCTDIYTYVPDDNFEQTLISLGYDDVEDNLVLTANISSVTALNISNQNIVSLVGIEDFVALQTLNCSGNSIENIDVSSNIALTNFDAASNNLTSLDLSGNSNLLVLDVSNNQLSNLELSNNLSLINFDCSNNNFQIIDLNNHSAITNFNCESNVLESLNIKNGQNVNLANFSALNNPNLSCIETDTGAVPGGVTWNIDATASYAVNCGTYIPDDNFEQALIDLGLDTGVLDNYVPTVNIITVTNLDVSNYNITNLTGIEAFLALQVFNCSNNTIIELDLTANTNLTSVLCNNNTLEFVDIRNGNNVSIVTFNATNNASLFCVNVDAAIIGSIPAGWNIDAIASCNNDCQNNRFTIIPDDNFEQALIDLGLDSGALDNQVLTANVEYLTSLNVSGKNIESLEGIKSFRSLKELECSSNFLNELDVSNMINLERLYCGSNYFLTNNTANVNGLLNTTNTPNLTALFCADNNLADLNVASNINLEELDCGNNNISVLDVSNNTNLVTLNSDSNNMSNLQTITINNTSLTNLSCYNNNLNTLVVTNYTALTNLNCGQNALTQLDITLNNALEVLDFSENDLTNINLSGKTNLIAISGSQNKLTEIDDLTSSVLETLVLDNNQISQINGVITGFPLLKYLTIFNNELTTLDVSSNINLIELNVSNNQLTALQLSNNLNQLKTFNCSNNQIAGDLNLTAMGLGICPAKNDNNPLDFCPENISINVSGNQLEFINIQNGINSEISSFLASNNPNLTCIQVDDINNLGSNWVKDANAEYSENCRFGETYVPDDNFEQALINLGYDVGALDDYVLTSAIESITDLDISSQNISDLTGIEDFTALQNLNCSNNNLREVNVSENENLLQINCANNTLSELIFAENTSISNINIANNIFTEFDTSSLLNLAIFNCSFNQLIELDFQQNIMLTNINCDSNLLEVLNLKNGQNPNILNLNAQNNASLTCIETDTGVAPSGVTWLKDAAASYSMNCHYGETYVPDDAFEQALIDLGLDSGTLDDYVLTSNINVLSTINLSEKGILDATGIQDFVALTNLNIEGNALTTLDISNNLQLVSLNASKNNLPILDVSLNTNLLSLNLSENELSALDVSLNLELVSLKVSNNNLTALNVDALSNLQVLNCLKNELTALQVVMNPNLETLYCQYNLLEADQLNLQNGNNQNLKTFNATNNPNLACILVDDPFEVISNNNGDYDVWYKDATANYQTICNDADNDGVANADDQCPNTPFGDAVDLFGCSVINLPNDNFTIRTTSETCLNNNDGKVHISTLEYNNYRATLTSDYFNKTYHFTNEIDILNLLAGTYELCITIDEIPSFLSCYTVVINQPEPLDVTTSKVNNGKQVSVDLSGSSSYNINFNGLSFSTSKSNITLTLQKGENALKISTDETCQGVYEEHILILDKTTVYPNPFNEYLNIYTTGESRSASVAIYSYLGQVVFSENYTSKSNGIQIQTDFLDVGIYTVMVKTSDSVSNFKIVKQ